MVVGLNSTINIAEESGNMKIELRMSRIQSRKTKVKNIKEAWKSEKVYYTTHQSF